MTFFEGNSMITLLILGVLAVSASAQTTYTVGDELGWTFPPEEGTYDNWAKAHTFKVGDQLVFNYDALLHNVYEVSQSDLQSCDISKPIATYEMSNPKITLTRPGYYGFICGVIGHCEALMKVNIMVEENVVPSPPPPPPPPSSPPPPPPTWLPAPSPPPPSWKPTPSPPPPSWKPTPSPPPPPSWKADPSPPPPSWKPKSSPPPPSRKNSDPSPPPPSWSIVETPSEAPSAVLPPPPPRRRAITPSATPAPAPKKSKPPRKAPAPGRAPALAPAELPPPAYAQSGELLATGTALAPAPGPAAPLQTSAASALQSGAAAMIISLFVAALFV